MYKIVLESNYYGVEEFNYTTLKEAKAVYNLLIRDCRRHYKEDGVSRHLYIVVAEEYIGKPE